ncbi:MAG: hypothetical protein KME31_28555 [Tolypothrix carrinoi HA7290-LM1]|jgi:hypothetical protein|nr:hypothetical protein [Tolypothrix carrinoi HA7290-LM1]
MDIFTIILVPLLLGIFTNRLDAILIAPAVEKVLKRIKQDDKQVNHQLEKALRLCFLSALQTIARECHKELIGFSPVQRYRISGKPGEQFSLHIQLGEANIIRNFVI